MDILFRPKNINIYYYGPQNETEGTYYLPEDRRITLKATRGFTPKETYNWQYCTSSATYNDSNWRSFASIPGIIYSNDRSEISFKGSDIFPDATDFRNIVESERFYVRIKTYPGQQPNVINLTPCLSAPGIQSITHELERCHDTHDASVTITFDRALEEHESFELMNNGEARSEWTNITPDANNKITVPNLAAKDYKFSAGTAYKGHPSYSTTQAHNIPVVPVITHSLTIKNVSCHGGSDGEITVSATGGNGKYRAELYRDGTTTDRWLSFEKGTADQFGVAVFDRLVAGNYTVRVFKGDGCTDCDDRCESDTGAVAKVVAEPPQPLAFVVEQKESPLAFDSHDGRVTLRVGGGTKTAPPANGYITVFRHEDGVSFTPAVAATDQMNGDRLYTFEGLGRGNYFISIRDKNYAMLAPEDRVAPCGCEAVAEFYLDAPPPLVVEIEETHFINWYGGSQGELTAHARGGRPFALPNLPYRYKWFKSDGSTMQPLQMIEDSIARNLTAGTYRIEITDRNGITKTADYELTEPDPIVVQFATVKTGCYGGNTGRVTAQVSGGVTPYTYRWNVEGATGNELTGLEEGIYMLKVTDARGGSLSSSAEVKSASTLKIDTLVRQPSCVAAGAISVQLTGATPPYNIHWDDSPTTSLVRDDLLPGTYRLSVTDANNCLNTYTFRLKEPRGFTVSLGDDLVMCRGQMRLVTAVCKEPNVTYEWFLNDVRRPTTDSEIIVDRPGVYKVIATNPQGCTATDRIEVRFTQQTLELEMRVPTTIEAGSETHAINLSRMAADRIEWRLPEEAVIISQTDTELVFTIAQKGSYTVSMEGYKGEGASIVQYAITVVGKGEVELPDSENPLIRQFRASPNPTTGYFKVTVELDRAEDFTMQLYSPSGALLDTRSEHGVQSRTFEYEINGTQHGTYILVLSTRVDKSALQVVFKR
ncbi:MAG: hypothetical protein LBH06_05570 [Rikenellaceae bacterium]|nr:hypothetical protein [Rikenellaceae bacterium]